ncbi:MAG: oligosaccharide flippase family protein [Acidobacteriota bacterium]
MVVFGVGGVVNRALSFLLVPFYTRHIPAREYGALAILLIVLAALPIVLRLGLGNALLRSWYDYEEEKRPQLATTVLVFLLATSIPLLLLMALLAEQGSLLLLGTEQYASHLRIICLLAFCETFNVIPDTLMRVNNASVQYSICQTIAFLLQLLTIISAVVYWRWGIQGILFGNLIGAVVENSLLFAITRKYLRWGFNRSELKAMLAFGAPLIFGRLAAICFQSIDRFFLKYYANLRIVGLYALGNQLAAPITLLVATPFSMIWANMQFATMKDHDANEYYARMLTYMVYLASFFALPVAVLAEDTLHIFATLRYWEAATVVPWLALAAVLDAANPVFNVGVSLKRKSYINPIIVVVSALINIGLNFLLIPSFGMMGAAVATVISYIMMCAIRFFIAQHLLPISYEWGRILKIVLVCLALFMITRVIIIERPIISFCTRLPFALMMPFALVPLGFYDEKERAKARELFRRVKDYLRSPVRAY